MKFTYKWPSVSTQPVAQQALLINKKTHQEASPTQQTLAVGTVCAIVYFFTLLYIYGSALVNEFMHKKNINNTSIFSEFKKAPLLFFKGKYDTAFPLNTLSSSFEDSERIGTTICVIIFLATLQGFFSCQNIYSTDPKRAIIIAFNYLIVLCWLLFLYIFPYKKGTKKPSNAHSFLAFCILSALIINCFLIINLYTEFFDEYALSPLSGITYAIVGFAVFAVVVMILNNYSTTPVKSSFISFKFTHPAVAMCEMACLVLFGVFLIIFTQYPPIPSDQLSCVMIPNPESTSTPTSSPSL